jgi:hypothetical protein
MDGSLRNSKDLSTAGKLTYISLDAARCEVRFRPFAETVQTTIGDTPDAALRLLHSAQRELYELAELLPDPSENEATPLIERLSEALNRNSVRTKVPEMDRD